MTEADGENAHTNTPSHEGVTVKGKGLALFLRRASDCGNESSSLRRSLGLSPEESEESPTSKPPRRNGAELFVERSLRLGGNMPSPMRPKEHTQRLAEEREWNRIKRQRALRQPLMAVGTPKLSEAQTAAAQQYRQQRAEAEQTALQGIRKQSPSLAKGNEIITEPTVGQPQTVKQAYL